MPPRTLTIPQSLRTLADVLEAYEELHIHAATGEDNYLAIRLTHAGQLTAELVDLDDPLPLKPTTSAA